METEFSIKIFEIMQTSTPSGRHSEDGEPAGDTIRNLVLDNWGKYEKIQIYFDGIVQMTRPFADEAFGKILEKYSLEDFNQKIHFPDANDRHVKELNNALKLRMKIIKMHKERQDALGEG